MLSGRAAAVSAAGAGFGEEAMGQEMRRRALIAACLAAMIPVMSTMCIAAKPAPPAVSGPVSITTAFDNYRVDPGLRTAWGFAAVVTTPEARILFDTGADGATLLANMRTLGIRPSSIDEVVISHVHRDHLGGLAAFLRANPKVRVWIPASFPESVRRMIVARGARVRTVGGPASIAAGVESTGELGGPIKEQALIVDTAPGLVIITGCAHPGTVNMVQAAHARFPNRPIAMVMGGFHLLHASDQQIRGVIRSFRALGVRRVAPSHCTGERARALFREAYGSAYLAGGAGRTLTYP